jgi:hypothetical protein
MGAREMLIEAATKKLPWTSSPLHLSAQESHWVGRLLFYRDSFDHPKQLIFIMTKTEVAEAIEGSVELIHRALLTVSHHIFAELTMLAALVPEIRELARRLAQEQ